MLSWLHDNSNEMYWTHKEGKSVFAERFIRTLNNKIYKRMSKVSKKMYINKLDEIVNKYNKTYNSTTKIKLPNV